MKSYQEMIDRITDIVCKNSADRQNYILIGDNSSGKSDVLRNVVKRKLGGPVYFIDSVNRTFNADHVELVSDSFQNIRLDAQKVSEERISLFNYNLRDTFCVSSCIEQIFAKYSSKVFKLCKLFLNHELLIVREQLEAGVVENQVLLDGITVRLTSGYQAVVRLFSEILYFCDVMAQKEWDRGFVVIDELDEYLSPRHSAEIFNFLQENFAALNFLVTTHSSDMAANTRNTNLILLYESDFEMYANSGSEHTADAESIFAKLFFEDKFIHQSDDDSADRKLRKLLNLKIAGLWDDTAQKELKGLKYGQMKPHQKMIYRQIEEW